MLRFSSFLVKNFKPLFPNQGFQITILSRIPLYKFSIQSAPSKKMSIPLNFYTSEKSTLSFLEINRNEFAKSDFENAIRSIKASKLFPQSQIEEITNLSKELFKITQKQAEAIDKILNTEIQTYQDLEKLLAQNNMTKSIENTYIKISNHFSQLLQQAKDSNDVSIIGPISTCLNALSILNLDLWKLIVQIILLHPEKFQNLDQLMQVLSSVVTFLNRFQFKDKHEKNFIRYHFFFPENELNSFFKKTHIETFFMKMQRKLIESQCDPRTIIPIINLVSSMVNKFSKVSYINVFQRREFLKQFEYLFNKLDDSSEETIIDLLDNFIDAGINSESAIKRTYEMLIKKPGSISDEKSMLRILDIWRTLGSYHKELYLLRVKPVLKQFIKDVSSGNKLASTAYNMSLIKLQDDEMWNLILEKLSKLDYKNFPLFSKKSLHLLFQSIKFQNYSKIDLVKYQTMINYLSKMCIGLQLNLNLDAIDPVESNFGNIDCCNPKQIQDTKEKITTTKARNPQFEILHQKYEATQQELFLKSSIIKYLEDLSQIKGITFTHDLPVCLYSIDLAINIPGIHDKIAIEISGASYIQESGDMSGKKKLKFAMLKNYGWVLCIVSIGQTVPYNLLAKMSPAVERKTAVLIYEQIRKEIQLNLNKDLPAEKGESVWNVRVKKENDVKKTLTYGKLDVQKYIIQIYFQQYGPQNEVIYLDLKKDLPTESYQKTFKQNLLF